MMIRGVLLQPVIVALLLSLLYMDRSEAKNFKGKNKLYGIEYQSSLGGPSTSKFCKYRDTHQSEETDSENTVIKWAAIYLAFTSSDELVCTAIFPDNDGIDKLYIAGAVGMMNTRYLDNRPLDDGIVVAIGSTRTLLQRIIVPKGGSFLTGEYALSSRRRDKFVVIMPHPGFEFWSKKVPAGGLFCPFVYEESERSQRIRLKISVKKRHWRCETRLRPIYDKSKDIEVKEFCIQQKYSIDSRAKLWNKDLGGPGTKHYDFPKQVKVGRETYSCTGLLRTDSTDH